MTVKIVRNSWKEEDRKNGIEPIEYRSASVIGIDPKYDEDTFSISFLEEGISKIIFLTKDSGDKVYLMENGKTVDSWTV